jgi:hypothetical protein
MAQPVGVKRGRFVSEDEIFLPVDLSERALTAGGTELRTQRFTGSEAGRAVSETSSCGWIRRLQSGSTLSGKLEVLPSVSALKTLPFACPEGQSEHASDQQNNTYSRR